MAGEPPDHARAPRRPGAETGGPPSSDPPATRREDPSAGEAEFEATESRGTGSGERTPDTERPSAAEPREPPTTGAKTARSPGQARAPSPSEIDAILKRFAPEIERSAPTAEDPTLQERQEGEHAAIAYDETLQVRRRAPRPADERLGAVIAGRYKLLRVIGEGGMGTVFEAAHVGLGKRVAVKILSGLFAAHDEASARFLREARASSAVESEHIVHVFDVGEDLEIGLYMVMELLKGRDVADLLEQRGTLPPELAAGIAWQVSLALERAHEAGIVHRDLKPANVFLTQSDDGSTKVRVLDFGIAKLVRAAKEVREGITRRGSAVGTPQYMSPEQAQGLATVDARTDFYSLGALLFECITGRPPYPSLASYEQTILKIMTEAPPRPSSLVPAIDPALDQLVADLMQREPAARPASLAVVRERLVRLYPTLPTERLVLGPAPRAAAGVGRGPERTNGGVAVESHRRGETGGGRRPRWKMLAIAGAGVVVALGIVAAATYRRSEARREVEKTSATQGPVPTKSPAEALVAIAAREEREGRSDLACAGYEHASDVDPRFAPAALAATLCHNRQPQGGRTYFRRAWAGRGDLGERDRGLVDALEAKFQRDPVDNDEWLARIRRLSERFPADAAIHVLLANGWADSGKAVDARAELTRAIALDSAAPHTLEVEADWRAYAGDFAGAQRDIDQCLKVAPGAIGCIEERAWIDGEAGRCSAVEAGGRRILSVEPSYPEGISFLANALLAQGSPVSAIRDLLRRRRDMLPEAERAAAERVDDLALAMFTGDLVSAETLARSASEAEHAALAESAHGRTARDLVAIEEELGRASEASKAADSYLAGRDAWEPTPRLDDWAMADEPTPLMLAARLHAGDLTPTAFERERARTIQRWESRVVSQDRAFIWIFGYAAPAETAAEATTAVDQLPIYAPLPPFTPLSLASADVGRTLFLAGRIDDAIAPLAQATQNCFPLDHPIAQTRAFFFLGSAREAKKDKAGACAAYAVVRDRWGSAKPRPPLAQKALARRTALTCPE